MAHVTFKGMEDENDLTTLLEIPVEGEPNLRLPLDTKVETTKAVADAASSVEGVKVSISGNSGSNS